VSDVTRLRDFAGAPGPAPLTGVRAEQPPAGYSGRTRYTHLEYEAVLANASIGIAFTRDRKFFLCNPRFAELFGWEPDDLIGQPGEVVYPSRESYDALGKVAVPLLTGGGQLDTEWEMRRRDGSTFTCRLIAKAINPENTQQGTIWIAEDVTERKRAGDEIARLLREQRAIFDTASIGIVFLRDGRIARCNRRFEDLFGYGPHELLDSTVQTLFRSDEDADALAAIYARLRAGGTYRSERMLARKDGSRFWCSISARAVTPAEPEQGTVVLFEDITERRHADESVQRLLKEQDALLENAMIGIVFVQNRHVMRCNGRFEELFGYAPTELLNRSMRALYASEDDYAAGEAAHEKLARGESAEVLCRMVRKDASTFWCHQCGRPVQPGDPAQGSVWLFDDVTLEREAEQKVQRALEEQQLILDNATVGITFVRNRVMQRSNRRLEEMTGYAPGELDGQSTAVLFAKRADWENAGREAYASTQPGGVFEGERIFRRKDGSSFKCRVRGRRIDGGSAEQEWIWSYEDVTAEREAEERLRHTLAEQDLILGNATVGIAFMRRSVVQRCNPRFEEMFGYGPGEFIGHNIAETYDESADFEEARNRRMKVFSTGESFSDERRAKRRDGSLFWCKVVGRAIDPDHPDGGAIWIYDDVTAEHEGRETLERTLAEQELILANATVGIAFVRDRRFQRCNARMEEMFGYAHGEMAGKSTRMLFVSQEQFDRAGKQAYGPLAEGASYSGEWQQMRKDGVPLWCKVVGKAIDPARPQEGSIWIFEDIAAERTTRETLEHVVADRTAELQSANERLEAEIAERKLAEERAKHLADHDALTALPNRRLLEDRLTQALATSYRNRKCTAVMFVDLDRFKTINDSLGHAVGDTLLREVARRLVKQMRVGDTICRIGGDEFVVVLPELKRAPDAAHVAQKVIENLSQPMIIEDRDLTITPSIGISVFPDDGRDAETLIRNADAAMYHAKEMGRANYQFFTDQMNLAASRRLALENDLRRALQKGELRVYYQPIIELGAGCVAGHEALLRWQHPKRGLVAPSDFIQLAEETGLIFKVGAWVLREACRWTTFIGIERGLPVAVNLSPRQFGDPKLVETVSAVLKETGLPARLLELEITESTAMQHTDMALVTMNKLKELGVTLVIDDFGTGYSSLAYLRRFPVDKLKIDKSFLADVHKDREHKAIVAAIIALAHALGIKVVAEGVETESQLEFVQTCRCDYMQGHLSGAPADSETAAKEYV